MQILLFYLNTLESFTGIVFVSSFYHIKIWYFQCFLALLTFVTGAPYDYVIFKKSTHVLCFYFLDCHLYR